MATVYLGPGKVTGKPAQRSYLSRGNLGPNAVGREIFLRRLGQITPPRQALKVTPTPDRSAHDKYKQWHIRTEGRGGVYSFVACLSYSTIDHAPLSRRSTAPTPNRGTSNNWRAFSTSCMAIQ